MNGLNKSNSSKGVMQVALSYAMWGVLPLYWKTLLSVPSDQIFAHRVIWSFVFVFIILAVTGRLSALREIITNKRDMVIIVFCALLIATNWYTYIWAVNSAHIVECSMGYYINPIISIILGTVFLREKMDLYKGIALILATAGILITSIEYGKIPYLSLLLAVTFALYGLLKKLVKADAATGIFIETTILLPFTVGYILWTQHIGTGALGKIPFYLLLVLLCAGVMTATPLLLFAAGAKKVELSTMGFLQYLSPTISLFLGIFLYGEKFSLVEIASFGLIWLGLIIFSISRFEFFHKLLPDKTQTME